MCIFISPLRQKHFPQRTHVKITKIKKSRNSIRNNQTKCQKRRQIREQLNASKSTFQPIKFQKTSARYSANQPITAAEIRNLPNKGKFDRCGQTVAMTSIQKYTQYSSKLRRRNNTNKDKKTSINSKLV